MPPRNKNLKIKSQNLRKNMTKQEKLLWYDYLSNYPYRFYRQRIIGNYIADFYCSKALLVVELDGLQHFQDDAIEYDKLRMAFFNEVGIKVIRFTNGECESNFQGVCDLIDAEVRTRLK